MRVPPGAQQSSSVQTLIICPPVAALPHICGRGFRASGPSLGPERVLKGNKQIYGSGTQPLTHAPADLQED